MFRVKGLGFINPKTPRIYDGDSRQTSPPYCRARKKQYRVSIVYLTFPTSQGNTRLSFQIATQVYEPPKKCKGWVLED